MPNLIPKAFGLLALLLACGPLSADWVLLTDGSVREGTIVEQNAENVTLEVRAGALKGKVVIPRREIAALQRQAAPADPVTDEAARLRAAAETKSGAPAAEAWVALGDFLNGRPGYSSVAQESYEQAVAIEPEHAVARRRLGHVKTDKGWVAVDAERRERGLVPLDEVWVKPAERVWLIDRRHEQETDDLRIGPRRVEPFTREEVEKELSVKRAEEESARRSRLRLESGDSLLSRYGYFADGDGLYVGSGYAPYYADGVGIRYGDSEAFFGTVGSYPRWEDPACASPYAHAPRGRVQPGAAYRNRDFGFTFGSNLSDFGSYSGLDGYPFGGYGGFGWSLSGGSKHFRYRLNVGGLSGSSHSHRSSGFGFGF